MRLRSTVLASIGVSVFLAGTSTEVLSQADSLSYANTPTELLPYREFREPYKIFFTEPQPFLGPGREKSPPPDLEDVRIGFLGPIEGSRDAPLGRRMLQGATLALEHANAEGGYNGLPFVMVTRNDLGSWGAPPATHW